MSALAKVFDEFLQSLQADYRSLIIIDRPRPLLCDFQITYSPPLPSHSFDDEQVLLVCTTQSNVVYMAVKYPS